VTSTTSPAESIEGMSSYAGELTQLLVTLGLFVVVLLAAAYVLPRLFRSRQSRAGSSVLRVVATTPLEAGKLLHVVNIAGRYVVIASSAAGVHVISAEPIDGEAIDRLLDGVTSESSRRPGDAFARAFGTHPPAPAATPETPR
jgi:flagellar biogenesis protein FliO